MTRKQRDEAILLLALCASAGDYAPEFGSLRLAARELDEGASLLSIPHHIAIEAWEYVWVRTGVGDEGQIISNDEHRAIYAEAESLLRTGWSP